jgi:hypothetical protein
VAGGSTEVALRERVRVTCARSAGTPQPVSSLGRMVGNFGRRLGVATGASTSLLIATWGGWRLAQLAGLAKDSWEEDRRRPRFGELATTATLAGVMIGGGYALMRPVLPEQPEVSGLLYACASAVAVRLQVNAVARLVGRERKIVTRSDLVGIAVLGLALAESERLFR